MSSEHKRNLSLVCILGLFAWMLWGCSTPPEKQPPKQEPKAIAGTQVAMDFSRKDGLYSAPFPSEDLRREDGRIDLKQFPNPNKVDFVKILLDILQRDARGFGVSSGIFFQMSAALDSAALPPLQKTVSPDTSIFLMGVERSSQDYHRRIPITIRYEEDAGPFGAKRLLSLLPLQGVPLREGTLYAAVVLRDVKDSKGQPLGVSLTMAKLAAGIQPDGLPEKAFQEYITALKALEQAGIAKNKIAGLAVFRTDKPTGMMRQAYQFFQQKPVPALQSAWKQTEVFDDFCVYESSLQMPVFQKGKPPFMDSGGGDWAVDAQGQLILQGTELSRVVVTIPRKAMPADGFPVVAFVRTGGGGDRPLVDRGVRAKAGGDAVEKGSGPARNFARAGYVGISLDGPHGGPRNVSKGDEQFLIFNITNPVAMRDNIRQSALELTLIPRLLASLQLKVDDCRGVNLKDKPVRFNPKQLVLMGHSMGATIGPLVLAVEPAFRAAILSGAGGSWIENIVYKKSPVEVRPLAELILAYSSYQRTLHTHDPALTLLQWGGEGADPVVYARSIVHEPVSSEPRHILMLQGIVDTYIMPPIANALSLSLGLDLAGESRDQADDRLQSFAPLHTLLPLVGRKQKALPIQGNLTWKNKTFTGVVIQHKQGPVEDGHEVVFQTEGPKHQYRCFLESLAQGQIPHVPVAGKEWDACR